MSRKKLKDFTGYTVCSTCSSCRRFNGKVVEKTIRKAFPENDNSTLYVVKVKGVKGYLALYENEMLGGKIMIKSIEEIKQAWNDGEYRCDIEVPAKVKEGYVFDEELSVRRNRELAIEHNQKVDDLKKQKSEQQVKLHKKLHNDIVDCICLNYNISRSKSEKIKSFVNEHWHANMYDFFYYLDTVSEFVEELLEME